MLQLVRNATVFAPEPLGRRDLLIADRRIAAIAEQLPRLPADIPHTEVDLGGLSLCPGLIDAHVHLIGGGGEAGLHTRVPPVQLTQLSTAGITTVVGVLGTDGTTRSVADLVARTLGLRAEGLSAHCYTGSYQLPVPTLTGSVRGDIVFIDPVIGVGELALSDHRSSQPTLDELLREQAAPAVPEERVDHRDARVVVQRDDEERVQVELRPAVQPAREQRGRALR